jgi:hypothetical protein
VRIPQPTLIEKEFEMKNLLWCAGFIAIVGVCAGVFNFVAGDPFSHYGHAVSNSTFIGVISAISASLGIMVSRYGFILFVGFVTLIAMGAPSLPYFTAAVVVLCVPMILPWIGRSWPPVRRVLDNAGVS